MKTQERRSFLKDTLRSLVVIGGAVAYSRQIYNDARKKLDEYLYQGIPAPIARKKTENYLKDYVNNMPFKPLKRRNYKRIAKRFMKKKGKRYSPRTVKKRSTNIVKQVKDLTKLVKSDQAFHTHKLTTSYRLISGVGACAHNTYNFNISSIETLSAQLRYYNPSVPGTLTTADPNTGTYSRQVHFMNVSNSLHVANNYQVPAEVRAYLCIPKGDTSIGPTTYYANGITDQVITGGDATTLDIYLTDIDVLKSQYSVKLLKKKVLMPGSTMDVIHNTGSFDYDPSVYDSHTVTFQPKFKNHCLVLRVQGVLGHDTTADEQNVLASGIDIEHRLVARISYDAGSNLNDIYITNNRDATFTNGGVISSKPVSDNIGYSVA